MPKYLWHLQQKCHDFCKKSLTPYHYIHITSHFAFFHTLLDFFNQSPRLLNIYNPALCVFALCGVFLPPDLPQSAGFMCIFFISVYFKIERLALIRKPLFYPFLETSLKKSVQCLGTMEWLINTMENKGRFDM